VGTLSSIFCVSAEKDIGFGVGEGGIEENNRGFRAVGIELDCGSCDCGISVGEDEIGFCEVLLGSAQESLFLFIDSTGADGKTFVPWMVEIGGVGIDFKFGAG
jgi:hypothetical protein